MRILSIETSCDETALAIVECSGTAKKPVFNVLKTVVNSQIALHREWGGVVPNIAKREHITNLPILLKELGISKTAKEIDPHTITKGGGKKLPKATPSFGVGIDAIAVTVGPGLEPALWAGIEFAKQLAKDLKKPLLGANHMEGHVFSVLLDAKNSRQQLVDSRQLKFPAIGLVVSGGHTILVKMDSYTKWTNLGETRDDAAGEAFDKVARLLELPYPGGPEISKLALKGDPKAIAFPRPMINPSAGSGRGANNYEFSFSGIKTSVLYYLRDNKKANKADIAASFQQAVMDVLVKKTMRAAREFGAQTVVICGGVAANKELRRQLAAECEKWGVAFTAPANEYNTDNAAMIAAAAYLAALRKKKYRFIADSTLTL
jgi:N6-L-threonylcarbamoyladenine synthase